MTWLGDLEHKLPDNERKKLIAEREALVKKILDLKAKPIGQTRAEALGRQEDLIHLAKKVKAIDKKLGRTV